MEPVLKQNEFMYPGSFSCPGCGLNMAYRHVMNTLGKHTAVVTTAGCGSVVAGYYPTTATRLPFFHCSFGTVAATASGLKAGYDMLGETHMQVVAWAGDGGTFDIGLQSLSGAADRNDDMIYVCYDNEAYMNTGVQQSSATPPGSYTTTSIGPGAGQRPKKDIVAIMAAHGVPYIATACVSYPEDLIQKVKAARKTKGFRFLHILIPCPTGWFHAAGETVRMGRLAVQSRAFPLFEVFDGERYLLSPMDAKIPVDDYLAGQGRFKALTAEDVSRVQAGIDKQWAHLTTLAGRQEEIQS